MDITKTINLNISDTTKNVILIIAFIALSIPFVLKFLAYF